jgi:hypothetical protein
MTTMAMTSGYGTQVTKLETRGVSGRSSARAAGWSWRAVADTASGLTFLGVLGWEVWRVAGYLLQLAPQVVAAGGGYLF